MPIRALIFDFDGLILDTETPEYEAWTEIYAAFGCELPLSLWIDSIGRGQEQITFDPYEYLSRVSGIAVDREVIRTRRRKLFHERILAEPLRPGVLAYLTHARARNLRIAVASSSDRAWVEGHLERLGILPIFDLTRCSDDVTRTKPDPELYQSALDGLGVVAGEAVAFEDSPNGVQAARAAGIYTVAVPNALTAKLDLSHASHRIASMSEMPLRNLLELPGGIS